MTYGTPISSSARRVGPTKSMWSLPAPHLRDRLVPTVSEHSLWHGGLAWMKSKSRPWASRHWIASSSVNGNG